MEFLECVKIVLDHEGGDTIVADPRDPGGLTRWGISEKSYPNIQISTLTKDEAIYIYEKDYWNKIWAQHIPKELRLMMFDCAVNQGVPQAIMMLQRALDVKVDGVMGDNTLRAVRLKDVKKIIDSVARQRLYNYSKNRKWDAFGKGWASRLLDITLRSFSC